MTTLAVMTTLQARLWETQQKPRVETMGYIFYKLVLTLHLTTLAPSDLPVPPIRKTMYIHFEKATTECIYQV